MRFISSNVEPTGACATVGDLATPMSMMPGTSVNAPRGGEGAAREVDGLGLHAASEAASAHGGSVSLANSPSGGAVATIAVPL